MADTPSELRLARLPGAPERHPDLFAILSECRDIFSSWLDNASTPAPSTAQGWLAIACSYRTWNLFKATVPLLERDLWEDALILIRSMFELLLNVEELDREDHGQEERAQRFLLYEKLQQYLQVLADEDYQVHSGRKREDKSRRARLEDMACHLFAAFRLKTKKGRDYWARSWCGKSVFELAEASKHTIRKWQYKTIYARCSAYVHATPRSVIATDLLGGATASIGEIEMLHLEEEKRQLAQATSFAVVFAAEILLHTGSVFPRFDPSALKPVLARVYRANGAEPPSP